MTTRGKNSRDIASFDSSGNNMVQGRGGINASLSRHAWIIMFVGRQINVWAKGRPCIIWVIGPYRDQIPCTRGSAARGLNCTVPFTPLKLDRFPGGSKAGTGCGREFRPHYTRR